MNPIIEVRNIGKKYDITHMRGGYVSLRDVIANVFKNPFSFVAHKAKRAVGLEKKEEFWALKGVSFNIRRGEVVGVIGANGAGKSTLLKILSQITPPTEGEIIIRGRVGSLLEVGTGFHPELTGRENIFLNGAILGMKKREIAAKFDEIVAFAGVDRFLDTPVKFYSSGMYVRLAFSVAAHMEPDILLVDEVLAVGDAEFQKKCLGKMEEITKKDGRTILFVSHNMQAVQELCKKCVLLKMGRVAMIGDTDKVIEQYLEHARQNEVAIGKRKDRQGDGRLRVTGARLMNGAGRAAGSLTCGEDGEIVLDYELRDPASPLSNLDISLSVDTVPGRHRIALISSKFGGKPLSADNKKGSWRIRMNKVALKPGDYDLTTFVDEAGIIVDWVQGAFKIRVAPGNFYPSGKLPDQGEVMLDYEFK